MDIVVLDGNQRSALSVTRSLGAKGMNVIVGSDSRRSLAASSRFCSGAFTYPSPLTDVEGFFDTVRDEVLKHPGGVLIPVTDTTLSEVLRRRDELGPSIKIPFVDFERYDAASDKAGLFKTAERLEIPAPRTLFPEDYASTEELLEDAGRLPFPLVIKPARSRVRSGRGFVSASVRYARDRAELLKALDDEILKKTGFLIQERITGPGVGVFLIVRDGEVAARFAHRRIREKPPSGGVSVLCESVEVPQEAYESSAKLLRELGWYGVAMVEFKEDLRDGKYKLMEINARFWGSLELAVASGVDFPYLLTRLAQGERVEAPAEYKTGVRLRWELGDLDHLFLRFKKDQRALLPSSDGKTIPRAITDFAVDFLKPSVRSEVFRARDPWPFARELFQYVRNLF